jgi:hypothetical protein
MRYCIVLISLIFGSCSLVGITPTIPTFSSTDEARHWIEDNVQYQAETGWEPPEETVQYGRADCRGYALLLAYILDNQFHEKSSLICIEQPGTINHYVVEWNHGWYSPQVYDGAIGEGSKKELARYTLAQGLDFGFRHCK